MKRLIACILGSLLILGLTATPVASTEIISENPVVVFVDSFDTEDMSDFLKATAKLKTGDTFKVISSGGGGNAWTCMSMVNEIKKLKTRGIMVITETTGMAASANAFLWLAGSERLVNKGDMLMFHLTAMRGFFGEKIDRANLSDEQNMILDHLNHWIRQMLLDIVKDTELVNKMLDDEDNWYTATEVIKLGIATGYAK